MNGQPQGLPLHTFEKHPPTAGEGVFAWVFPLVTSPSFGKSRPGVLRSENTTGRGRDQEIAPTEELNTLPIASRFNSYFA